MDIALNQHQVARVAHYALDGVDAFEYVVASYELDIVRAPRRIRPTPPALSRASSTTREGFAGSGLSLVLETIPRTPKLPRH
jgi:hypothetical protein